ncbi:MAG: endoglucanase, partial [Acetobacter orientalis]
MAFMTIRTFATTLLGATAFALSLPAAHAQEQQPSALGRAWNDTRSATTNAWDKTKDGTVKAWDKTKSGTEKAWDKTKSGT